MRSIRRVTLILLVWLICDHRLAHTDAGRISGGEEATSFATLMRAADFVDSIGVNTHLAWSGSWARFAMVEAELAYLGVAHIRDSVPTASTLEKYLRLAARGTRFDIILTGPTVDIGADLQRIDRLEALKHGSVAAIEGINEFNVNHATFDGQSSFGNYAWGRKLDEALAKATRADNHLKDVAVIASSLANAGPDEIRKQGDLAPWVDASNWHAYFSHGDQPSGNIRWAAANARATAPGKPVYFTESGYYTAVDAMAWGGGGVDEDAQAKMTLNLLLDAGKAGVARTYLYELMDNVLQPARDDLEDSFGVFRGDGHPKRAAVAIHNLVAVLAETAEDATSFAAARLSYALRGTTAADHSLLLARSDGTYDLIIWNEMKIWNETEKRPVAPVAHTVTVEPGVVAGAEIFDPLVGTAAVQRVEAGKVIDVTLGDHPLVIAISPSRRLGRHSP